MLLSDYMTFAALESWLSCSLGFSCWAQMAFERGLAPDDDTLLQLTQEYESPFAGEAIEHLRWPEEPLRSTLISMYSCTCSLDRQYST